MYRIILQKDSEGKAIRIKPIFILYPEDLLMKLKIVWNIGFRVEYFKKDEANQLSESLNEVIHELNKIIKTLRG